MHSQVYYGEQGILLTTHPRGDMLFLFMNKDGIWHWSTYRALFIEAGFYK